MEQEVILLILGVFRLEDQVVVDKVMQVQLDQAHSLLNQEYLEQMEKVLLEELEELILQLLKAAVAVELVKLVILMVKDMEEMDLMYLLFLEQPHNLFIILILQELEHLRVDNLRVEVLEQVLALLLKQVKVEEV